MKTFQCTQRHHANYALALSKTPSTGLCIGFIENTVDGTTNQEKRIIISIRFNLDNLILNKVDMKMEMDEKIVIAWRGAVA